jgi:hypothetical protein
MVIDTDGPAGNVFWLMDIADKLGKRLGFNTGEIVSQMQERDYPHAIEVFNKNFSEYVVLETQYENEIGMQQKGGSEAKTATPKELKQLLFDNSNLYGVLFDTEFTNDDLRRELFLMNNDKELSYRIENDCVLIQEVV